MARYLTEHDRYLASLASAHHDAQEHARALLHEMNRLEHALYGSGETLAHAAQDATVAATTQDVELLRRVREEKNTETETQDRPK